MLERKMKQKNRQRELEEKKRTLEAENSYLFRKRKWYAPARVAGKEAPYRRQGRGSNLRLRDLETALHHRIGTPERVFFFAGSTCQYTQGQ